MLRWIWVLGAAAATIVASLLVATGRLPLGIPGEWEWGQIGGPPHGPGIWFAGFIAVVYLLFVSWGSGAVVSTSQAARRVAFLGLLPAAFVVQWALQQPGYGLAKWPFVLFHPGPSGYYTVARTQVSSAADFLAEYERFQQDFRARHGPFHLATHPPGLVLLHYGALRLCESNPQLTRWLVATEPASVRDGFRSLVPGWQPPRTDEASIWLVAVLTQAVCAATVLPLYRLARIGARPQAAWLAVAFWPLVPAAALFCPKSDVLYAPIAAAFLALAISGRSAAGRRASALAAGLVLWAGLFLSFALTVMGPLAVLVIWLVERDRADRPLRAAAERLAAVALGLLGPTVLLWLATGHNLVVTWKNCYVIHASFYSVVHRSYWPWVAFNLAEFSVAVGIPLAAAAVAGTVELVTMLRRGALSAGKLAGDEWSAKRAAAGLVWAWWLTLVLLDLSGKNLGEVARLWIFLMPFAVPAAAIAVERLPGRWPALVLLAMQATLTILLVANVQGFFDPSSVAIP